MHCLPGNLTSDDPYEPDAIPGTGAGDAEMERTQKVREAAVQAHAIVSIRDRVDESLRARPRIS
eukprot:2915425-Lingulodinium_polyedra.AAC.1